DVTPSTIGAVIARSAIDGASAIANVRTAVVAAENSPSKASVPSPLIVALGELNVTHGKSFNGAVPPSARLVLPPRSTWALEGSPATRVRAPMELTLPKPPDVPPSISVLSETVAPPVATAVSGG